VLFFGGIAANLVSTDLETAIAPYRVYVWLVCGLALVTAVGTTVRVSIEQRELPTSPVLSLEWSPTESASPEQEIVLIGQSEYGSSLILKNRGPGSEKLNRIVASGPSCQVVDSGSIRTPFAQSMKSVVVRKD
jgi:hypothetical protein